jgi:hypothetical protein
MGTGVIQMERDLRQAQMEKRLSNHYIHPQAFYGLWVAFSLRVVLQKAARV